jgi:hypothetical protein
MIMDASDGTKQLPGWGPKGLDPPVHLGAVEIKTGIMD